MLPALLLCLAVPTTRPVPLAAALPGGGSVELVAVAGGEAGVWHAPDGTPRPDLGDPPDPGRAPFFDTHALVTIRPPAGDERPGVKAAVEPASLTRTPLARVAGVTWLPVDGTGRARVRISNVTDEPRLDLYVGVATGEEMTLDAARTDGEWPRDLINDELLPDLLGKISFAPPTEADGQAAIAALVDIGDDWVYRLIAVGKDGTEHAEQAIGGPIGGNGVGVSGKSRWAKFNLPPGDVAYYALRGRRVAWVRFEDVAARPQSWMTPRADVVPPDMADESGPIDRPFRDRVKIGGESLGGALARIGDRGRFDSFEVRVDWVGFARYQPINGDTPTPAVVLESPTPLAAVRAVLESAGLRDFTLMVDRDGEYVMVRAGKIYPTLATGRPPGLPGARH